MTVRIERPLTDAERSLLMHLAAETIADQTGYSRDLAYKILDRLADRGELVLDGDPEFVCVFAGETLLTEVARDWLSFSAQFGLAGTGEIGDPPR